MHSKYSEYQSVDSPKTGKSKEDRSEKRMKNKKKIVLVPSFVVTELSSNFFQTIKL